MIVFHQTSRRSAAALQRDGASVGLYVVADRPTRLGYAARAAAREQSPPVLVVLDVPEDALVPSREREQFRGRLLTGDELVTTRDLPVSAVVGVEPAPDAETLARSLGWRG